MRKGYLKKLLALVLAAAISVPGNITYVRADENETVSEETSQLIQTSESVGYTLDENKNIVTPTGQITRAEWLHNLAVTFDMELGDNEIPDNYYSDITVDTEYYSDIMKVVAYGIVDIEAGKQLEPSGPLTREFAAQTLNACLGFKLEDGTSYSFTDSADCKYPDDAQVAVERKWFTLIGGKFMPSNNVTTAEWQNMLKDATTEIVKVDVKDDYDSKWEVAGDVKEVPQGTEVEVQETTVTITKCPIEISDGDKFVVYQGEIAVPYEAVSVSKNGDITQITTKDVENYNSAFDNIDAEGVIESDEITFIPEDGVNLEIEESEDNSDLSKASGTKKVKDIKFDKEFKIGSNLKSSISGTFKNIQVKYRILSSKGESFVKVDGDLELTGAITATYNKSIPVMKAVIPGIGGITLTVDINAMGKISTTVTSHVQAGVSCSESGIRMVKSFKELGGSNVKVEATASLGATLKLGVTDLKIVSGYIYGKIGMTAKVEDTAWTTGEPRNCKTFLAYMYASYGAEASCIFIKNKYSKSVDIFTMNNSPVKVYIHYEDGRQVSQCTRGLTFDYYTRYYSSYWDSGVMGCDSSYGLDDAGQPYAVYEYEVKQDSSKNDYAVITKYRGNMRNLTIPETLDGYEVRGIGEGAFKANQRIRKLTVSDTITDIGEGAFWSCMNLSDVKLSKNLLKMGGYAFGNCDALTSIDIPKSLQETYEGYAYSYGGEGGTYKYGPFIYCDNLKNITFEKGVSMVPRGLFANNDSIEEIKIPDTVVQISTDAFFNCSDLKNVDISDSVTEICTGAFWNCSNLSNVIMSKNLTKIGAYAFGNCDSLTSIDIPKTLKETYKGYAYFYGGAGGAECYGPFINCDNLKKVNIEDGIRNIPSGLFANNSSIENVVIPNGVTEICKNAFQNCSKLQEIELPSTLTKIDEDAFRNASSLLKIDIPNSVTEIGVGAFWYCSKLSDVKLSKGLNSMGAYAFGNCSSLTSIEIPKSLKTTYEGYAYFYGGSGGTYKNGPFIYSNNLKSVTFEEGTKIIADSLFENNYGIEKIELPNTVTTIGTKAFKNCTALKQVELSKNLISINYQAFCNDSNLERIEIPDSVTGMGEGCFMNCSNLQYAKLPAKRVNIMKDTFYLCKKLESIELPDTVENIGEYAFAGSGLKSIRMSSKMKKIGKYAFAATPLESVEFFGNETEIGEHAFDNCDGLTSIKIPNSVTEIGNSVFLDCNELKDIVLGNGITYIPVAAFCGCDKLENLIIPYGVKEICSDALKNCTSFSEITIPSATTAISSIAFSYYDKLTIYGVKGSYAETFANDNSIKFVNKVTSVTNVSLNTTELLINRKSRKRLILNIDPIDFTGDVVWKSTDTKIATVDDNGNVKGVSVGDAIIKVSAGDKSISCKVTVAEPVSYITLNKSELELEIDDTYQLDETVYPEDAYNQKVVWSSSDTKVATVSENGKVKAVGKGTATIRATATDGTGEYAECDVNVTSEKYIITDISKMESSHPYENNCKDTWIYTVKDAKSIEVTFSAETEIEEGFDSLYIYDANDKQIGKYSGKELAGKTINIQGNTIKIKLDTDKGGNAYGFKIEDIKAVDKTDTVKGDVNGDGITDSVDAVLLKKYLAGYSGLQINTDACDMNGDGEVDSVDAVLLLKQLANG